MASSIVRVFDRSSFRINSSLDRTRLLVRHLVDDPYFDLPRPVAVLARNNAGSDCSQFQLRKIDDMPAIHLVLFVLTLIRLF